MGVLACDRKGCDNIMCDRLSHRYGYICNDCFEELVNRISTQENRGLLVTAIEEFMDSDKYNTNYTPDRNFIEAYLDKEFSFN